jgi:hypothetical protein
MLVKYLYGSLYVCQDRLLVITEDPGLRIFIIQPVSVTINSAEGNYWKPLIVIRAVSVYTVACSSEAWVRYSCDIIITHTELQSKSSHTTEPSVLSVCLQMNMCMYSYVASHAPPGHAAKVNLRPATRLTELTTLCIHSTREQSLCDAGGHSTPTFLFNMFCFASSIINRANVSSVPVGRWQVLISTRPCPA